MNGNRFQDNLQNENLRAIKNLHSNNFCIAHIPTSSSKTTAVLTCSKDQQLPTSKGSIIYTPPLINLQGSHTAQYDFISSPTEVIPFSLSILESSNLPTAYMLDQNDKIVTGATANLEKKTSWYQHQASLVTNNSVIYKHITWTLKLLPKDLLYLDLNLFSLEVVSSSETKMLLL